MAAQQIKFLSLRDPRRPFRDSGIQGFQPLIVLTFQVAASRARKRPREQPQPQPQPKDNEDNQNHNRNNQNQNPKQPQPEQPPPEQPPEEAEDDPWKIALRRHFRLVKYREFEATRFQNVENGQKPLFGAIGAPRGCRFQRLSLFDPFGSSLGGAFVDFC